jgi:hypothetical protein
MDSRDRSREKALIITLCARAVYFFNLRGLNTYLAVLTVREISGLIQTEYLENRRVIPEDIIESVATVNATARQVGHPIRITL